MSKTDPVIRKAAGPLAAGILAIGASVLADQPVHPVKVSPSGRYFVDQKGAPVFWLGTTQWQLFRDNTPAEAAAIIAKVRRGREALNNHIKSVSDH